MKWTFIEVPPFLSQREACFKGDENFRRFQLDLMQDPQQWGVIPGAAPLRKARWGDLASGKGKSGGWRIIYMQIPEAHSIFLFHAYPKSRRENLSPSDARILGRMAKELRDEVLARMTRESVKGSKHGRKN